MDIKKFEIGAIRPPFHADSLLLRVTENCTWNRCNFCTLYRSQQFKTRGVEEIKSDIDSIEYYKNKILKNIDSLGRPDMEKINSEYGVLATADEKNSYAMVFNWITADAMKTMFLQDANTLVLKSEVLADIIRYIREKLPELQTIAAYGRADTLAKISQEDFHMLKAAGLNMLHSGFETGSDEVLKVLNKGVTAAQQLEAGRKIKNAEIEFNVFYMPGAGGRALSDKNAIETAEVISALNPDFIRIRTFVVKEGTPMWEMAHGGNFEEMGEYEKVYELRKMIESLNGCTGYIISDHIINLLPGVEGYLNRDKEKILNYIDEFLALPEYERRLFQLARRVCFRGGWKDMHLLNSEERHMLEKVASEARSDDEWEEMMRGYLRNYI